MRLDLGTAKFQTALWKSVCDGGISVNPCDRNRWHSSGWIAGYVGSGGGIAHNETELVEILTNGLRLSRVGEVLVERCIAGWKEIEYEVMRDAKGNCITVCNMENIDPVGVHTGDSIVVAILSRV